MRGGRAAVSWRIEGSSHQMTCPAFIIPLVERTFRLMDTSRLAFPAWYQALTLTERYRSLSDDAPPLSTEIKDLEPGQRRLARWRGQPPFDDEAIFARRLAVEGLDAENFSRVLSLSAEELTRRQHDVPPWMATLEKAYTKQSSKVVELPPGEEILGFLELVQPLVDGACLQLAAGLQAIAAQTPSLPYDPETIEDILLFNLADPLLLRLGRTMALELNIARLQGELDGHSPEERFQDFLSRLHRSDYALAILAEYPVLARQLIICIEQWVDVSLEFVEHLCRDWDRITERFCPDEEPGLLVDLMGGAGDTHRQGHSVMIAEFESGFRVVYKPKSMAVDEHFQMLLEWVNSRGCQPPLRTLKILDRESHGWVEHIEYEGCKSVDQVKRYYRRLGLYLALLYAINASDFHLENLIAAGEQPVLIDLETLFNPEFERFEGIDAETAASQAMLQSVLVVAMLPQRLWTLGDYAGIDISGLGGEAGQLSPDRTPLPTDVGTDAMRYVRERLELTGEANRPTLDGVESNAVDFVEDVVAGFIDMYEMLMDSSETLLAADGPLASFANDEVRVLLRPTRTYDQLLYESFHPDMLQDGLERDRLFDRLWIVVPERAHMAAAIPAEQAELRVGDIPVFTTQPNSLQLMSGTGDKIDGILTDTGLDLVRRRVQQLNLEDMRRQVWFIRSSLATLEPVGIDIDMSPAVTHELVPSDESVERDRLYAAAFHVAERLAETALLGDEDVTWLGLESLLDESWDIGPLGMDLYGGIPGIGLFLAHAGDCFGDERFTELARRVHNAMSRDIEEAREEAIEAGQEEVSDLGIGAFEGWGGLLYALTHLGILWKDPEILAQAGNLLDLFPRLAGEDEAFGVVRGSAGAIVSLLAYERVSSSNAALQAAVICGDHLLASSRIMEQGSGWVSPRFGSRPLSGLGHGAAGIAWALFELAAASGEGRFGNAALRAIDYERSLFSAEEGNWLDIRDADSTTGNGAPPPSPRFATAWCHGAPGIGISRLRCLPFLDELQARHEIDAALNTTLSQGFGRSHCLCHGDMGNLELLFLAEQILGDPRWAMERQRTTAMVVSSIERDGWQCGGPGAVEMPTLMLGLAGIGYQLLRLADPARVPSVLTLEAPVLRTSKIEPRLTLN